MPPAATAPPSTSSLPAYLRLSKNEIRAKFIDLEWQQRDRLLQGVQAADAAASPWWRLTGDEVSSRNRYLNVEPFARNRVQLRVKEGLNDYINASYVVVGRRRFIVTQGPKDSGLNHFWRMLAAEPADCIVIVMLTQTHEAGREKCSQYYPLSMDESPLEILPDLELQDEFRGTVVLESIEDDPDCRCEVRKMSLRTWQDNEPPIEKKIVHLLFAGWPDFVVPEGDERVALIELVRKSAMLNDTTASPALSYSKAQAESNGGVVHGDANSVNGDASMVHGEVVDKPRVIHCSAGVGRSGTFIALDALLAALQAGNLDNVPPDRDPIAETVDTLRQQRMMMVQSESQFLFLYDIMRELTLARMVGTA